MDSPIAAAMAPAPVNYDIQAKRKMLLAQQLMKAGEQPTSTEVIDGVAVKQSPLAALARAVQSGIGQYEQGSAYEDLNKDKNDKAILYKNAFDKLQTGDYTGAAGILSQDPDSIDSALKLTSAGIESKKADRDSLALIAALGGKAITTDPSGGMPLTTSGLGMPHSLPTAAGGLPLSPPSNNIPSSSGNPKFDAAMQNGGAQVLQDMGGDPSGNLPPLPNQAPAPAPPPSQTPDASGKPFYQGGAPITKDLPDNTMLVTDKNGQPAAVKNIPNLDAKKSIDTHLSTLSDLIDKLDSGGGVVNNDKNMLQNIAARAGSSEDASVLGVNIPGGQKLGQYAGTKNQTTRDQINQELGRMMFDYMRAAGLTPGMERTVQAQQMVKEATGNLGMSKQALKEGIKRLSMQLGNGGLAQSSANSGAQFQSTPSGVQYRVVQ